MAHCLKCDKEVWPIQAFLGQGRGMVDVCPSCQTPTSAKDYRPEPPAIITPVALIHAPSAAAVAHVSAEVDLVDLLKTRLHRAYAKCAELHKAKVEVDMLERMLLAAQQVTETSSEPEYTMSNVLRLNGTH